MTTPTAIPLLDMVTAGEAGPRDGAAGLFHGGRGAAQAEALLSGSADEQMGVAAGLSAPPRDGESRGYPVKTR